MILLLSLYIVGGIIWLVHCIEQQLKRNKKETIINWIWGSLANFLLWPISMVYAYIKYGRLTER